MAKYAGYKQIKTNVNIGGHTHGKFVSSANGDHQKPGKKGPITSKPAKEKLKHQESLTTADFMKKTVAQMRKQGKRVNGRVAMADGSGAFH